MKSKNWGKNKGNDFNLVTDKEGKSIRVPKKKFGWTSKFDEFLQAKRLEKIEQEHKASQEYYDEFFGKDENK